MDGVFCGDGLGGVSPCLYAAHRPAATLAVTRSPARVPLPLLQVESDIGPYKGLLMGLFFMTGGWVGGWAANREKYLAVQVSWVGGAPS